MAATGFACRFPLIFSQPVVTRVFSASFVTLADFRRKPVLSPSKKFNWVPTRDYQLQEVDYAFEVAMTEVQRSGDVLLHAHCFDSLVATIHANGLEALPPRDLKIFYSSELESSITMSILARPKAGCFLLEMEHLKLICLREKCFVLNPHFEIVRDFAKTLADNCSYSIHCSGKVPIKDGQRLKTTAREFHRLLTSEITCMAFEHMVLELALASVTSRLSRHVSLTKPALERLLQQISIHPSSSMLRRLLAFRKSLTEFEAKVIQVRRVLEDVLTSDEDMTSLYLTSPRERGSDHHEVELLLEAYSHDINDIIAEIKTMKDMVEETNQFINTHLDTVRNRLLRMGIFMDMGMLALTSGTIVAGLLGMNLINGYESNRTAFPLVCFGITAFCSMVYITAYYKFHRNLTDTSMAHSFKALKSFFQYVDELDRIVEAKHKDKDTLTIHEFRDVLNRLTGTTVTMEETEFIFKMFDTNRDGKLNRWEVKLLKENRQSKGV